MSAATSAFAQLRAAVRNALLAEPALAGGHVRINAVHPVPDGVAVAINVRLLGSRPTGTTIEVHDWHTQLAVECYARAAPGAGDTGAVAEEAADALLRQASARLRDLASDSVAAGLGVLDVQPLALSWDHEHLAQALTCAVLTLGVTHRTSGADLDPWGQ